MFLCDARRRRGDNNNLLTLHRFTANYKTKIKDHTLSSHTFNGMLLRHVIGKNVEESRRGRSAVTFFKHDWT